LNVLEKNGLLAKKADQQDKRVTHLAVTRKGRSLIARILPSPLLQQAGALISDKEWSATHASLQSLLNTLQRANHYKTFGQCDSCQHNLKTTASASVCGLTQEPLTKRDVKLICREHEEITAGS
jgi:DNA-binding PadR family transcriptional regulator